MIMYPCFKTGSGFMQNRHCLQRGVQRKLVYSVCHYGECYKTSKSNNPTAVLFVLKGPRGSMVPPVVKSPQKSGSVRLTRNIPPEIGQSVQNNN